MISYDIADIERRVQLFRCVFSTTLWRRGVPQGPAPPQRGLRASQGPRSPFVMDINTVAEPDLLR